MSTPRVSQVISEVHYTVQGGLFKPDHAYLLESFSQLKEMTSLTIVEKQSVLEPMIKILQTLQQEGLDQFLNDPKKTGQATYFRELAEALLQRNYFHYSKQSFRDLLAFQAVVNILHTEMLTSKIGALIQRTLFPIAIWGNSQGPFTYYLKSPLDEIVFQEITKTPPTIVKLPVHLRDGGLVAWSSIGHEIGGHSFLRSIPGLMDEIKHKITDEIQLLFQNELQDQEAMQEKLVSYWAACAEELASDVLGVLNLGPAFAIGLVCYLKGKNENDQINPSGLLHSERSTPTRSIRLKSDSFPNGEIFITNLGKEIQLPKGGYFGKNPTGKQAPTVTFEKLFIPSGKHPIDLIRIMSVLEIIESLEIEKDNKYTNMIRELIEQELNNLKDGKIILKEVVKSDSGLEAKPFELDVETAQQIANCAAKAISHSTFSTLHDTRLIDLISWTRNDEKTVKKIQTQFSKLPNEINKEGLPEPEILIGRHILAASILETIYGEQRFEVIFSQMKKWLRKEAKETVPGESLFDSSLSKSPHVTSDSSSSIDSDSFPPEVDEPSESTETLSEETISKRREEWKISHLSDSDSESS